MHIFNSLGSNYDFNFALKALFNFGNSNDLKKVLQEKYNGEVVLLYKGREAIQLALKSLNLPNGSFVAINGFTCFAVYEAVKKTGFNVEYLDIEKGELNFSANTLEKAIKKNPKMKAVIIQNTLGYPCQIEEVSKICKENKIFLIEDLAHCVGSKYEDGREAGTVGDMTILSFSQDKMIDGISGGVFIKRTGDNVIHLEGGADLHLREVGTKIQLIDRLYPLFTYLIRKTYPLLIGRLLHEILKRLNLLSRPMDGVETNNLHQLPNWYTNLIKAAFDNLEKNLNHRRKIASIYSKNINKKILSTILIKNIPSSSNLRFPIFVNNRDSLIKYLSKNGVFVSDIWYDSPIAPKKYLSQTDYTNQCPNAELASAVILNLPTHKNVSNKDAENISKLINQWLLL